MFPLLLLGLYCCSFRESGRAGLGLACRLYALIPAIPRYLSRKITIYHLPTKENKLPFYVSVCSKQTKVCRFCFPFAANNWKLLFSVSFVFHKYIYIHKLPFQTAEAQVYFP
jgi:hypothetical protein